MPKFHVEYTIHGRASDLVEAESQEEAEKIVLERIDDADFDPDLDSIDDVDFHMQEMHPVVRDGKQMWTSRPLETDQLGHPAA